MINLKNLPNIPREPGCYIFKTGKGVVLYVGKAKDLKKRVKSYFQKRKHDAKTIELLKHIELVDFIVTKSEVEALILENNLIKKHYPKYNINLKDSKRYAYLMIKDEKFPRLILARTKNEKGKYYGPFVSAQKRDYVLKTIKNSFKLRTCKKFPKKPCLRYHINLCDAPCIGNISEKDYDDQIKRIEMLLKGKTKELKRTLKNEMKIFSKNKDYETAIEKRNQIEAIEYLDERQNVEKMRNFDQDIINYIIKDNKVFLILFNINKGVLENKQEYEFSYIDDFLEQFIIQYYSENIIPKEIILPEKLDNDLVEYLEKIRKNKVIITNPKIGDKNELLELVKKNVEVTFFSEDEKLEELKKVLDMQDTPRVIECFDISHLGGTSTVASMVQFRNARPDKNNYRKFKIKTVDYIDDFASLREVVRRRYYKLKINKEEYPDLIIIDGGKGQLSSALGELDKLDLKIPIISIAKEFEEIFTIQNKEPIRLDKKNKALQLVQQIRDEAHRFAINYNKLLRKKKMFG